MPSRKPAHGFWTGGQRTLRTDRWRLIVQPGKEGNAPRVELFDYLTDAYETRNHAAEQPETVRDLMARLDAIPLFVFFTPRPNAPAAP